MRFPRCLILALIIPFALLTACNRGARPAQTGKVAPDFSLNDGSTKVHLADYRGKVVVLNFWGTWCAPCLEEIPSLVQLHHQMPSLQIVGVAVPAYEGEAEDPAEFKAFVVQHHMDFTTVRDTNESAPHLFHTDMWPETYIIDRKGIIRSKIVGDPPQGWTSPEMLSFLKSL